MSRGTPAELPDGPYQRPSAIDPDWVVRAVGENAQTLGVYDFNRLPGGSALWGPLAAAFAGRADSGGSWRASATLRIAWFAVQRFVRWLVENHPHVTDLGALTPAMWREFLLSLPPSTRHAQGRPASVLLSDTAVLRADTRAAVERPIAAYVPKPQRSLDSVGMQVVERRALAALIKAERRIRKGWALVEGYRNGRLVAGSDEERLGRLLDHVATAHDAPRRDRHHLERWAVLLLGQDSPMPAFARLYLTAQEAAAGALALSYKEGLNKSVVLGLEVGDISRPDAQDGSEQRIFRIETDKPRRADARFNSLNLVDTGKHSSAYLLGLILAATQPGRRQLADLGLPHDGLFLFLPNGLGGAADRVGERNAPPIVHADAEQVLLYGLRRWRASLPAGLQGVTFQNGHRSHSTQRGAQGHSEATNLEVYKGNDSRVQEAQVPIIASGVQDAYEAAMEPRVLSTDASAAPDIPADQAAAIDAGELDTGTASCTDYEHSPFDDDRPCTASFLSCLGCRNAVVVPRQLPRLVYLHQRLEGLRGNVSENLWRRQLAVHWDRLTHLLNDKFQAAERAAVEHQITDFDRAMIDSLLLRRWDAA